MTTIIGGGRELISSGAAGWRGTLCLEDAVDLEVSKSKQEGLSRAHISRNSLVPEYDGSPAKWSVVMRNRPRVYPRHIVRYEAENGGA